MNFYKLSLFKERMNLIRKESRPPCLVGPTMQEVIPGTNKEHEMWAGLTKALGNRSRIEKKSDVLRIFPLIRLKKGHSADLLEKTIGPT